MLGILVVVLLLYGLMILIFLDGLQNVKNVASKISISLEKIPVSIVIPFRNEEKNLAGVLTSIAYQDYPKNLIEVILVNDNSEDNSLNEINQWRKIYTKLNVKVLNLWEVTDKFGKKAAIHEGIKAATNEIIVTTDADCLMERSWLTNLIAYLDDKTQLVCGPVEYEYKPSFLHKFYSIDFKSLILSGAAAIGAKTPTLCNGANMLFRKQAYFEVIEKTNGREIASGDDVFLLHAIAKQYGANSVKFAFSNEAMVITRIPLTLIDFIKQRIRWGSKAKKYKNAILIFQTISMLLICYLLVFTFLKGIFDKTYIHYFFILFAIKAFLDFIFLYSGRKLFKYTTINYYYPFFAFIYPFYISIVSFIALFYKSTWKGRKIK